MKRRAEGPPGGPSAPAPALSAEHLRDAARPARAAVAEALLADHGPLGRLDEHPALPTEGELERLAGSLADQRLQVHVGLDRLRHARRPADRGLRVGEG